jgi:hypothetical protein
MDYRFLVETKNEFNNLLSSILIPHIYYGIKGMFKYSDNVYKLINKKIENGSKIENPGLINIFKKTLEGISNLNNHEIEQEYLKIKNSSGCTDWFDNLIRASIKSHVLFLTWDPKSSESKYSENDIYNNISIKDFLHKCYIISCNYFRDNSEIFINRTNKKEVFDIIKTCIDMAIKKTLPYNKIIEEYLDIEFNNMKDNNSIEIANIKNMVYKMMNNKKYGVRPNILVDDDNSIEGYQEIDNKVNELKNFINLEELNLDKIESVDKKLESERKIEVESVESMLSRASLKNKELNSLIQNQEEIKLDLTNNELENIKTVEDENIEDKDIKSIQDILNTPPIIKINPKNRIKELKESKNIKVILERDDKMSDNFEKLENYYENLLN